MTKRASDSGDLPPVSRTFTWCFHQYLPKYVAKNFHAVALLKRNGRTCPQIVDRQPVMVVLNHPSWWDPLMGLLLARHCMPARRFRAPIDGEMLKRYAVFGSLGFFGVERSTGGLREFVRTSQAILASNEDSLWVTPEGRFADVRDDAEFEPGVGHLAASLTSGVIIPLAAEYPFWEEKSPEALAAFGDPIAVEDHAELSKAEWTDLIRRRLRSTQAELAEASVARDVSRFEPVLHGGAGVGGFYDLGRRMKSLVLGRTFRAAHGEKLASDGPSEDRDAASV